MSDTSKPLISIITPMYNEEKGFERYLGAVDDLVRRRSDLEFEIILVDDGSGDRTWQLIEEASASRSHIRGLRLSRNFGAHTAITAAIDHASGDCIAILAADLQDPIQAVERFIAAWQGGAEIVWGKRRTRRDGFLRGAISSFFMVLLRRYAMPRGSKFQTGSFFLIDRKVAQCYAQFRESGRITFALVAWTGFRQEIVEYDREQRIAGSSGWSVSRLIGAMLDAFLGFSSLPVLVVVWAGLLSAVASLTLAAYIIYTYFVGDVLPGWTSIMLGQTIISAITFFILAINSAYLRRIFQEAKQRPIYFIAATAGIAPSSPRSTSVVSPERVP